MRIKGLLCALFAVVFLLGGCAMEEQDRPAETAYTLSEDEAAIVALVYKERSEWETNVGSQRCWSVRFTSKNGHLFMNCSYSDNKDSQAKVEKPYLVDVANEIVREASFNEYGSADVGIVTGTISSYNTSDSASEKQEAIAKALVGKSSVIIPWSTIQ